MSALAEAAYRELFGCRLDSGDHDHPGDCDWGFSCSVCGRWLAGPCPDHAPMSFPGLQLVECSAEPRHPVMFMHASEAYPPPCMYCLYEAERDAHAGCEHKSHGRWRSWKITGWVSYRLGSIGIGHFTTYGSCGGQGGCCHTRWQWGSGYILGKHVDWWGCLLRRHHLRTTAGCDGESLGWLCAKCAPCPGCDYCAGAAR